MEAMRLSGAALLIAGAMAVGACLAPQSSAPPAVSPSLVSTPGVSSPPMMLAVSNGTTIPVTLVINGIVIETIPPGGYEDPVDVPLPPLPWSVETRSPSGRVLSAMTIREGDVVYTTPDGSGRSSATGDGVRVDLACGRLDVWSGPPMLGPMFSPGPISCD